MTNRTRVQIFGGVFALLLAFQAHADTLRGKVINVADGDTITVLDGTHTQQTTLRALIEKRIAG